MRPAVRFLTDDLINLKEKPLAIVSCCPTSPFKWCEVTSQNLIDCARNSIPVEIIAVPLSGFISPVTLTGKYLNLPTQACISMSDTKRIDAQAGLESGMGATLAALSGINSISGPGMIDILSYTESNNYQNK